ncbi:hypothetical protein [Granulicella sp. S190]|uniref:hypothetical protein n=1 Tax=Granulicella sp. S190 TaxID=1747226 RepID=UPI00131EAB67|nr:hypothetical protein [Granulicella sp. S190]
MRLPFPERIPFVPVFYFAGILCIIQMMQKTSAIFSLCCFFYIIVATIAFNVAGGFTRTSGAFIFFNSTLSLILALCVKAYLGEPADSNLSSPILTITVYLAGMCMMLFAAYFSRRVAPRKALLADMVTPTNMQTATVGSLVMGILFGFAGYVLPSGPGSVVSALNQLNRFLLLAIILGVINSVRRSGGRRSTNLPVLLSACYMFYVGVVSYSKEGMFAPFACWFLAAASVRFRVSRPQLLGLTLAILFMFRYLVPYSQYGRTFKDVSGEVNLSTNLSLLSNLGYVREQYLETSRDAYEDRILGYYNTPQGLFDRLQMVSIDDAIINHTELFGTFGLYPMVASIENLVPHFIWKDKPAFYSGNVYAHEVGVLGADDDSTGVSFSSTATSYHLWGWKGIFFLAPALWFFLFYIFDSLCGDIRKAPWGLLVLVLYTHAAPEADAGTIVYMCYFTAIIIIFAAVFGAYVMPVIGTFLIGPEGIAIRKGGPVRSIRARLIPSPSPKT